MLIHFLWHENSMCSVKSREHCKVQTDYVRENDFEDTLALVDYRNLNTEQLESNQDSHAGTIDTRVQSNIYADTY